MQRICRIWEKRKIRGIRALDIIELNKKERPEMEPLKKKFIPKKIVYD